MRERNALDEQVSSIRRLESDLDDGVGFIELGEAESDEAAIKEGEEMIRRVQAEAARRQVETLLSGEADGNDTYLEVHSGAGGTESQDWAQMLARMYARGARSTA
jgi:peptide chain release factor 2